MIKFELKQQIKDLIQTVLKEIKIHQNNIGFDEVKAIHIGDGVRMVRAGLAANRPTSGERAGAIYFETDTPALKIYDGSAWQTI